MRGQMVRSWISTGARLALGGILIVAGGIKAADPVASVRAVRAYELLPEGLVHVVGYGLPFLEIALGVLLIMGFATRWAAGATAALMVIFIAGIISAWARGLSIDCGCFGGGGEVDPSQTQYVQEILRDVGYIALAAWLIIFPYSRIAFDRVPEREPVPAYEEE